MPPPPPACPQQTTAHEQQRKQDKYDHLRNLQQAPPHPPPQLWPSSSWRAAVTRSLCCSNEPPSPCSTKPVGDAAATPRRERDKGGSIMMPAWSSSLDDCVQGSDVARCEVVAQLRAMMADLNNARIQSWPPPPDAPGSERLESGRPRFSSSMHMHAVSELGTGAAPARPQHPPHDPELFPSPDQPTPLTALLYFTLELPHNNNNNTSASSSSSRHHRGASSSYLRHFAHPMRLPLTTAAQRAASTAHLRGYLTEQPARFLSHFAASHAHTTTNNNNQSPPLVVHFPDLFAASASSGAAAGARIWGPELRWAWADASEVPFAEAVVGALWGLAEGRARRGRGGLLDLVAVVREVVDGPWGYGMVMDVRRVEAPPLRRRAVMVTRAGAGERLSIH